MAGFTPEMRAKSAATRRARAAARRAMGPQSEVQEELAAMPKAEVLGTVKPQITESPQVDWSTRWISPDGTVVDLREPPPWAAELRNKNGQQRSEMDARTFVDFPETWVTRWMDPKRIDTHGFRGWRPMPAAGHPAVKLRVTQMRDAANNIRTGLNGPILCFMTREHWEMRLELKRQTMLRKTQGAIERQDQFTEDAARGKYGRYVQPGYSPGDRGQSPINPVFDGRAVAAAEPT